MNRSSQHRFSELRLIAKSIGLLALLTAVLYLRVIIGQGLLSFRAGALNVDTIALAVLLITATVGLFSAWRYERGGALVAILSASGLAILVYLTTAEHKLFAAFLYSSPFIISGALFLACWWRERPRHVSYQI